MFDFTYNGLTEQEKNWVNSWEGSFIAFSDILLQWKNYAIEECDYYILDYGIETEGLKEYCSDYYYLDILPTH